MTKRRIPFPSVKTILLIIVVVVYTTTLTLLLSALIYGVVGLHIFTSGNVVIIGYEAHGGDLVSRDGSQAIDWGTIYVGTETNRSFYLKNKSNIPTVPQLQTANLTFFDSHERLVPAPATNPIVLNWTFDNASIDQNQEVYVTLTLTIKHDPTFVDYLVNNNIGTFAFDIIIQPS